MTLSVGLSVIGDEFETDGFLPSEWQRQQQVKAKFPNKIILTSSPKNGLNINSFTMFANSMESVNNRRTWGGTQSMFVDYGWN